MKTQNRTTRCIRLVIALCALVAAGTAWSASSSGAVSDASLEQSAQAFSNARLKGMYGGVVHGEYSLGTPDSLVQFAGMLVTTFDGRGNFSGLITSSDSGVITSAPITGTYQVNPDGTGSLIASFPGGVPDAHVAFVILNNGKEIASIQTDPGTVVSGTLKKQ